VETSLNMRTRTRVIVPAGRGSINIQDVMRTRKDFRMSGVEEGVLNRYPLLPPMRDMLSRNDTLYLLHMSGCSNINLDDVERVAWGRSARRVGVMGYIPYADAASLSAYAGVYRSIYTQYQYYM
jgi:hypothetical protein